MRKLSLLALSCLALAACGEGGVLDESVKTTVREQLVATCTATAEGQIPEGVTVDLNQVCDCAADKVMDGKSVQDLVTNPPTSAEDLLKVRECLNEMGPVKLDPVG
ncbi:MAG: hypothetical protein ACKVOS_11950 [Sphingorhabdus sp.]|uniref:hypothetical protein n=1 Tax=Sphingorhabdus sp. TaxID=1902408 RepID=UPI0038FCEC87